MSIKTVEVTESAAAVVARENIRRGIAWLSEHASAGWELRLLGFTPNGQAWCVAHDSYSDQCVLALAFGDRTDFSLVRGRVSFADTMFELGLTRDMAAELGFDNSSDSGIPRDIFDKMWEHELFKHLAARPTEQQEHAAA